jgi:hypothetical protein
MGDALDRYGRDAQHAASMSQQSRKPFPNSGPSLRSSFARRSTKGASGSELPARSGSDNIGAYVTITYLMGTVHEVRLVNDDDTVIRVALADGRTRKFTRSAMAAFAHIVVSEKRL